MTTTEIVFVRHGETRSNLEGLLHGQTDEPLNELGRRQAMKVARRLTGIGRIDSVHSSPLSRAKFTANAIASQVHSNITFHNDLAEFHFGDFEGSTIDAIKRTYPDIYQKMFDFSDLDFRFPHGESRREFHQRVLHAVEGILGVHAGERLVIVAHEGVIVSAVTQMAGGDPNDWTKYRLGNCSITRLEMNGAGAPMITCWNDVLHLADDGGAS